MGIVALLLLVLFAHTGAAADHNIGLITATTNDTRVAFAVLLAAIIVAYVAHRVIREKEFRFRKKRK
ncbi:MAG: hypothetical protein HYY37_00455 [Candidatus Aenigmarchaeota archaeon]|nr:hypothetical protein [Candidatus Aenigmarchaeota archaeon]